MKRVRLALVAPMLLVGCAVAAPSGAPPLASPTGSAVVTTSPPPTSSPSPVQGPASAPSTLRPSSTPDAWVAAGRFQDDRVVTQLATLGTGEVLAVGDDNTCGVESAGTDTAELWDPETATWSGTDSLPSLRTAIDLVGLVDGRALVTGGANPDYVAKSSTVVFDPTARRWSTSGLLDTARLGFASAALHDGRVLVAGGQHIDASYDGRALSTAEIWDPRTEAWSRVASMSTARQPVVARTLADGRVLVVGGLPSRDADVELASAEVYDPVSDRWSPAGGLNAPRRGFALVDLPDGGALVLGGERRETVVGEGETFYPVVDDTGAERFDPISGTWSAVDGWSSDSGARPAAVAMRDGRVLVVDGPSSTTFDPVDSTWTATVPIPAGRYDASAVLLHDGSVLIAGGWSEWPEEGETPSCPVANTQAWRFVPGS